MKNKLSQALDKLSLKDTYSMIMFILFQCHEIPEVAPLTQLIYLMKEEEVIRLLKYFGGQTITFPKVEDLEALIYMLTLYQEVELEGKPFDVAFGKIPKAFKDSVKILYNKVIKIMEDYSFVQG